MTRWKTSRKPQHEDAYEGKVWCQKKSWKRPRLLSFESVCEGDAWQPLVVPEPYSAKEAQSYRIVQQLNYNDEVEYAIYRGVGPIARHLSTIDEAIEIMAVLQKNKTKGCSNE